MIETSLKLTDVGLIPVDWHCMPISSLSEIITGGTPSTGVAAYWGGNIRWMNSGELNLKFITEVEGRITNAGLENSSTHLIPEHCVLIGLAGQGKTRGTAAYNLIPLCTNQSIAAILPNDSFCPLYLYYFIDSLYLLLRSLSAGDGGRGGLNKKIIGNLKVAIPDSLDEQRAIAEALSDIDKLIAALDKKIEKQKMIKQGVMQELLTGKRRLDGFSEPWVEKRLGDILQYEQPTKYIVSSTEYQSNGIPVLTAGKTPVLGYTNETDGVYRNLPVIIFDDFVTCSKYITFPFKVKSSAMKMLTLRTDEYNLKMVYELMQMVDFPLTDHKRYWIGEYSNIVIQIPSSKVEQDTIASILDDYDKEIQALVSKREKFLCTKQGMMQQLLTGKIRLIDSLTI
jgi:type I restriction enzyme, S subunit